MAFMWPGPTDTSKEVLLWRLLPLCLAQNCAFLAFCVPLGRPFSATFLRALSLSPQSFSPHLLSWADAVQRVPIFPQLKTTPNTDWQHQLSNSLISSSHTHLIPHWLKASNKSTEQNTVSFHFQTHLSLCFHGSNPHTPTCSKPEI